MSLFRAEQRSLTASDLPWSAGGTSLIGGSVEAALRLIPLYAAVSAIADDISTTPVAAFQRTPGGVRQKLDTQPPIVSAPSHTGSQITWIAQALASMLLWGNAFGLVTQRNDWGDPQKAVWLRPDRMQVDETNAVPVYSYGGRQLPTSEVIHVPAFVLPGSVKGLSPVQLFRLQLSKSQRAQEYAEQFYSRGIMPPGVLRNQEKTLKGGDADIAKARFKAAVQGREPFVTGKDWEWTALQLPSDDAKFLETIKAGATEIAAIYRMSAEDIGGVTGGSSITYATLEMNELKYNRRTLLPWARRLEDAWGALLPDPQYVRFNLDANARVELKTRTESSEIGLRAGILTIDEARALEDRPPLTPEQIDQWQNFYGARKGLPTTTTTIGGQGS